MKPWDAGGALKRAGRPLPPETLLQSEWGYTRLQACLFALGYLEAACGPFSIDTRLTIERAYALADGGSDGRHAA